MEESAYIWKERMLGTWRLLEEWVIYGERENTGCMESDSGECIYGERENTGRMEADSGECI